MSAGLRYNSGSVVAANIVEGAQNTVIAADDDNGLTGDGGRDEVSRRLHLIRTRNELPTPAEYARAL
jgi:hypothetical protein